MSKVLHSADLHFSNKPDKLSETVATTEYLLAVAVQEQPDVAVLAGDLVDEHDSPIRIDSDSARAAISFVTRLAAICPVVIVRGTRSHDRESPYIFQHLKTRYPVYVGTAFEQVALFDSLCEGMAFADLTKILHWPEQMDFKIAFTLLPSPDKANMITAIGGDSQQDTNRTAKEALHDALAYFGSINDQVPANIPRIAVGHGMITGAEYSSGQTATGEDLEYSLNDLAQLHADLVAFGHVHRFQHWGNVFYSGSPGRLNMGEVEPKGFLIHTLDGRQLVETRFIETPARRFVLTEASWDDAGLDGIMAKAAECESQCQGADVRFRFTVPEECRHQVNRDELKARFEAAGARLVKIEMTIIPAVRIRAAGISRLETLPEKVEKWGTTTGTDIPTRVLDIARTIEGRDVEELIEDAKRQLEQVDFS